MRLKQNWLSMIGLAILAITVLSMLISTAIEAWVYHSLGGVVSVLALLGAGGVVIQEARRLGRETNLSIEKELIMPESLAVVLGGLVAYALAHELALGAVLAASLVGLLVALIWPEVSVAAYCGAFVGMTSELLLFNYWEVTLAGLIASVVFVLTGKVFNGFGGKLGTIALVGTTFTCLCLNRAFLILPIAEGETNALILATALLAAPLTFYFSISRGHGPVLASAVVGMTGGILLPGLFPQIGPTLAVVAICASFAGMTSQARCANFWHILLTGLFTGVIFVYSTPLIGGAGGKLGTIAFGAVLGACGLIRLVAWVMDRRRGKE